MRPALTRRRFLTLSAAAWAGAASGGAAPVERWSGRALGAQCSMQLAGVAAGEAGSIFRAVEHELTRLERIFSLYRTDSQLVQLNRAGMLAFPAPEMLELLSLCDRLFHATQGAFDPTLQPLWMVYARAGLQRSAAGAAGLHDARSLIGWDRVRIAPDRIRFDRDGMALTLNGVAQGYITDRIAALLRQRGLSDVLIDMGEIAALGQHADGSDWYAGIAQPDGTVVARVTLRDRALATSAPAGTVLNAGLGIGHILDPRPAASPPVNRLVSVSAPQAAVADGLSTAGCLLSSAKLAQAIGSFPRATLEFLS